MRKKPRDAKQKAAPERDPPVGKGRKIREAALWMMTAVAVALSVWALTRRHPPSPVDRTDSHEAQYISRLSEDPSDYATRLQLANYYYDVGKPHLAIPEYRKVLDAHPDNPNIRTDLGTCFKRIGALEQARAEYKRVLKAHPEHQQATFNLAVVSLMLEEYDRAAELWERVAARMPGSATAEQALKHAAEARRLKAQSEGGNDAKPKPKPEKKPEESTE